MAWWGVLKHAPWGEIAKAASRVPEFVRDFRKTAANNEPVPPTTSTPVPGAEQLKFEIEVLKSNLERLRSYSESQTAAMDAQSKALTESFRAITARMRALTWITAVSVIVAVIALIVAWTR
ncbi:MAG: hypothetical protein K2Y35_10150 [Burkholderiales bacterium]|nr:hypothetical protein [Burkholderiales bacterium]